MSKATKLNFETLENPYNGNLDRGEEEMDSLADKTGLFRTSGTSESASEVDKEVSGQDLTDLWISSWIKSRGYKPKTSGFLLDGKRGYIECMKLYVGDGGIEGGSIHIPNETADDSSHSNSYGDSWWGCNVADLAADVNNAKAYILKTGQAKFQNAVLSNNIILSGLQSGSEIAIQGWQQDVTFSVTDYRIVAWTSGTITLLDGTTYSITGANTGNMSVLTYIYLDIGISITALQTTTTAATAVGSGKILIGVAQNNSDTTSQAIFKIFGGSGEETILVDNIAANSASVNEFISNSAQIANAVIGNAHITGTITVGKTDAKCTDANADQTSANNQGVAWLNESVGSVLPVANTDAKCTDANADQTSLNIAADTAKVQGYTIISGGLVATSFLTATNIVTGTMNAARINSGDINGVTITGVTVTGGTFQTSASAVQRVVITGSTISYYDSSNHKRLESFGGQGTQSYFNASGSLMGGVEGQTTGASGGGVTYGVEHILKVGVSDAAVAIGIYNTKIQFFNHIMPKYSAQSNVGSSTYKWQNLYLSSVAYIDGGGVIGGVLRPSASNSKDLGTSSYKWRHLYLDQNLYLDSGQYIYWNGTSQHLRHDGTVFRINDDLQPTADGTYRLGYTNIAWYAVHSDNYLGCNLPTSNSGIGVFKKIKKPQIENGKAKGFHAGKRHYFKIDEFPDEMKMTDKDSGEKDIELTRTLGVTVSAVRELVETIDDLTNRLIALENK